MRVEAAGQGPAVVLAPGFAGHSSHVQRKVKLSGVAFSLTTCRHSHAFRQRGHGAVKMITSPSAVSR